MTVTDQDGVGYAGSGIDETSPTEADQNLRRPTTGRTTPGRSRAGRHAKPVAVPELAEKNGGASRPDGSVDRLGAIWSARLPIILGTVGTAILVFLVSSIVPPVYTSSATVSLNAASTPGGSAQDVALASNALAAQDAQLVQTDSVLSAASQTAGVSASTLRSHLSAGTVGSQNLIQITMQAPKAADAPHWADAVAVAFQASLIQRADANSAALQNNVAKQSAILTTEITQLQQSIAAASGATPGSAALAVLESEENQLTNLIATRATLTSSTALAIASQHPNVNIVVASTAPSKVSPKPAFYSLIGALIALLVGCQLAVVMARRREMGADAL